MHQLNYSIQLLKQNYDKSDLYVQLQQRSMSELSPQIRAQLQKLAEKQAFVQSIDEFVRVGVSALCGSGDQYVQQSCPTALVLAFSHCFCNNIPLSSIASQFPQKMRQSFIESCERHATQVPSLFKQQGTEQMIDMQWSIDISFGRELWNITLKYDSGRQTKMILNYEQLSVLVFKLGQAVAYVQNYQI